MKYIKDTFTLFNYSHINAGVALCLEPNRIKESIYYLKKEEIKALKLDDRNRKFTNLDFLKDCDFIESIFISTEDIQDYSGIQCLKNLRFFASVELTSPIDFSSFQDLGWLSIIYNKNVIGLSKCKNLYQLYIEKYNKNSLSELRDLVKMESLWLDKTTIQYLEGIENMVQLKRMEIDTARKLVSLNGLNETLSELTFFNIYNAMNLRDYNSLGNLKNLSELYLTKTGEINSISFIEKLTHLERVVIGAKVTDGNMTYLKGIKEVFFNYYPHYTHKLKDFNGIKY